MLKTNFVRENFKILVTMLADIVAKILYLLAFKPFSTQAILLLRSMSEKLGSDLRRLWNWIMNFKIDSKSIKDSNPESLYVVSDPFRHWFQKYNDLSLDYP